MLQRFFAARRSKKSHIESLHKLYPATYHFPHNPRFEEEWAKNPQYYDTVGLRLRKVELSHWRLETSEFTDVVFVLEGNIMVETAIGVPDGAGTRHAVELVWQVARDMGIMDGEGNRAILFSDAYNVRKATMESRKVAAEFYQQAVGKWECYLFINPVVRVMLQLSKPFAPAAFRAITVVNSFGEGIADILQRFAEPTEYNITQPPQVSHQSLPTGESTNTTLRFPSNPFFEEQWKFSLEYVEYKGLKLRKIQPPHWQYVHLTQRQTTFLVEGVILVDIVVGEQASGTTVQATTSLVERIVREMGGETMPFYLLIDGRGVKKSTVEARKLSAKHFQWLATATAIVHQYLVVSPIIRTSAKLARPFLPEAFAPERLTFCTSFEEAFDAILATFAAAATDLSKDSPQKQHEPLTTQAYHQQRIEQIYSMLAKISDNEFDTLDSPSVPESDIYADVFKAMDMVYEDKRRQVQEILHQKDLLEYQSAKIQRVNVELSERNTQLDEKNRLLEELNHEKDELMGIVAHDLKNPISTVRLIAEMFVQPNFQSKLSNAQLAEQMMHTADRMLGLVTNLLDVNALESGKMPLDCIRFDIVPVVWGAADSYRNPAAAKQIVVHFEPMQSEAFVFADERAIMQIMDNLVSNAVKYSPHHSNVRVSVIAEPSIIHAYQQRAGLSLADNCSLITVKDEGPGISPDDMRKLFGKFARLSAQPTGDEHSTGLGLSIVKKLVEVMHGRVWCESELGKGATFIVELPASPPSV